MGGLNIDWAQLDWKNLLWPDATTATIRTQIGLKVHTFENVQQMAGLHFQIGQFLKKSLTKMKIIVKFVHWKYELQVGERT